MTTATVPPQRITTLFSHLKHVPAHKRTTTSAPSGSPGQRLTPTMGDDSRKKRRRVEEDVDSDDLDGEERDGHEVGGNDGIEGRREAGKHSNGSLLVVEKVPLLTTTAEAASLPEPISSHSAQSTSPTFSRPAVTVAPSSPRPKSPYNYPHPSLPPQLNRSASSSSLSSLSSSNNSISSLQPISDPLPSLPVPGISASTTSEDKGKGRATPSGKKDTKGNGKAKVSVDFESYAHLKGVPDYISFENDLLMCGINPGIASATKSQHYGNPTNKFWRLLHLSSLIPIPLASSDGQKLLEYNIGITNLSPRPTRSQAELSPLLDLRANVPLLLSKIEMYRPRVVCFVGKGIWREVEFVFRKAEETRLRLEGKKAKKEKGKGKGEKVGTRDGEAGGEWGEVRGWKVVHGDVTDGKGSDGDGAEAGEGRRVRETVFWVVGSTSGLVRETMDERLPIWRALKSLVDRLESGQLAEGSDAMKVVEVEGVGKVVEDLVRQAELKRGQSTTTKGKKEEQGPGFVES